MLFVGCSASSQIDKTTKNTLDLNRYLGKWYEIARFDHSFERGMIGTTAEYTVLPNGKIEVINSGLKDGKIKVAKGKARIPDLQHPRNLEVSFFLWFYAEYNILELDEEHYQYALIGSKSDKYLWILNRKPQMDQETKQFLLTKARERGYQTENLIWLD